ncbi:YqhG family protein [Virgibacillus halophilus]|uniref:YqhG family protein n=1 Tax=Tigheibacillus halophilus TaxID=361280 RepID=A0ABU5CDI5_9BACI|nr:YqhG family protein [Virgibacillus halophilus]
MASPNNLHSILSRNKHKHRGEYIHFGSPRLQQIISHLKTNERFTRLYQYLPVSARTPLYPWLVTNIKLSYIGKQKKRAVVFHWFESG